MITSAQEYLSHLQDIRNDHLHTEVLRLPSDELVYAVDLNARTVDAPIFLSTETDHVAETVFFSVDRYYENFDLADSTCLIQYVNANDDAFVYVVPVYDLETYADEGKMLIPWIIQGNATVAPGVIKYALRFYRVNKIETINGPKYEFDYIINTQVASSKILNGMGATYLDDATSSLEEVAGPDEWEILFNDMKDMINSGELALYWRVLD